MDQDREFRHNGLQDFQQWKKQLLTAIEETIDTIKRMGYDELREFCSQLQSLGAACVTIVDDFRQQVLSELKRALDHIRKAEGKAHIPRVTSNTTSMTYKELALLGTTLTGIVIGGVLGIVIVGAKAAAVGGVIAAKAAAVGGVIGGCVLFGACLVGTKWRGFSLNTKCWIAAAAAAAAGTVGAGIGGVVCLALGAAISGPMILLGSVVGLALFGGAAVIGYLADGLDLSIEKMNQFEIRTGKLEKDKEVQKQKTDELEARLARLERLVLNMPNSGVA